MQRYLLPKPTSVDPNATGTEALRQASDSARSTLVSMTPVAFLTMIGTLFTAAVVAVVVSRSVLGRTTTLSDTWAEVRPRLLPLSGLALLLPLAIVAAMAVCIGPGLLLGSGGRGAGPPRLPRGLRPRPLAVGELLPLRPPHSYWSGKASSQHCADRSSWSAAPGGAPSASSY